MKPRPRKVAVILGSTALLGVAGCGGASQAQQQQQRSASRPAGGAPAGGAPDLSALAGKLGVATARLENAMQATRPGQGSGSQPPSGDPAVALAKALSLPVAKVRAALRSVMPAGAPPQSGASPQAIPTTSER